MFWDAANSRLGIGTNAPANDLTISKTVDGVVRVGITNLSTGTNAFSGLAISNSVGAVALQLTGTGNTLVTPNQARLTTGSTITNGFTIETGTTAPITIGTSNTIGMTMFGSTRNVVLQNGGTFTDSGERLQVTGDTLLKGSGATVGTFGLKVQNSALTNLFRVRNDGAVFVEAVGSNAVLYMSSNGDSSIQKSTSGTNGMVLYGPTSSHHSLSISSFNSDNYSNGALSSLRFSGNFISASGSTAFSYMLLNGTINQTGTSTSIVRGLYVNPTLTAAADFRAIETARGNVVFGNLPTSSAGLPTGAIWNDAGTIKIV
jgi:hypothetical protein